MTAPPAGLVSLAIWLFVSMAAYPQGVPFVGRTAVVIMGVLSILTLPAMVYASKRVKRAKFAYLLQYLGVVPGTLASLLAAMGLFRAVMGWQSALWLTAWMTAGMMAIPLLVSWHSRRLRQEIRRDGSRWNLIKHQGLWDASKDAEEVEQFNKKPPLWASLLLMIAPALGLNLRRVVGMEVAILVLVVGTVFIPYFVLSGGALILLSRMRFFSELEREIGRPILLAEEA